MTSSIDLHLALYINQTLDYSIDLLVAHLHHMKHLQNLFLVL